MTRKASLWTRREVLLAAGAGVVAPHLRLPYAATPNDSIKIRFFGVMLLTESNDDGSFQILLPRAEGPHRANHHADGTPATEHFAYLGVYAGSLGANLLRKIHLLDADVRMTAGKGAPARAIERVPSFGSFTNVTELRTYQRSGPPWYATRITLMGGSVRAIPSDIVGTWAFPKTLNANAPIQESPVIALEWDTGVSRLTVSFDGVDVPSLVLEHSNDHSVAVGHLPMQPENWFGHHSRAARVGDVDHDFKWLYNAVIPAGAAQEVNPWASVLKGAMLPAPVCTEVPVAFSSSQGPEPESEEPTFEGVLEGHLPEVQELATRVAPRALEIIGSKAATVGSPNCFFGRWR